MRLSRTLISAISAVIVSLLVVGCAEKKAEDATVASMQSTQEVKTLGGRVTVKIPADLQPVAKQEGIAVYMNEDGGVTVVAGDSPDSDAAALMEQAMANMKLKDPGMKVVKTGETKFGEHVAKTVQARMKSDGKNVHMAMAMTVLDNKLVSIQVIGPQSKGDEVDKVAKAIFGSVEVTKD